MPLGLALVQQTPLHIHKGYNLNQPYQLCETIIDEFGVPQAGAPRSLNGWRGEGQVRKAQNETSDLLLTLTITVSQEEDPEESDCGLITISATAAETLAMVQSGYYEVPLINIADDNDVEPFLRGPAFLIPRITVPAP